MRLTDMGDPYWDEENSPKRITTTVSTAEDLAQVRKEIGLERLRVDLLWRHPPVDLNVPPYK